MVPLVGFSLFRLGAARAPLIPAKNIPVEFKPPSKP